MPVPTKANELQQILMASQWMSRSIPNYNNIIVPLQDIFESAMKNQPRRTKRTAAKISLDRFGRNDLHTDSFHNLTDAISHCVQLAFPNDEFVQCVFCDASYNCSSGVVTQTPPADIN